MKWVNIWILYALNMKNGEIVEKIEIYTDWDLLMTRAKKYDGEGWAVTIWKKGMDWK